MKTIRNKAHTPIRVPLPRGKVLHLSPGQEGQISHNDVDHEPLQKLVESGVLEILEASGDADTTHGHQKGPQSETHGHHPQTGSSVRGDR